MKTRTFNFFSDPGHAWLEVDRAELDQLGIADQISSYSYQLGDKVYLEEDCDAGIFLNAIKQNGQEFILRDIYQDPTPIRGYARYTQAPRITKNTLNNLFRSVPA